MIPEGYRAVPLTLKIFVHQFYNTANDHLNMKSASSILYELCHNIPTFLKEYYDRQCQKPS